MRAAPGAVPVVAGAAILVALALPASIAIAGDDDWVELVERVAAASRSATYEGRLVIVAFGERGPTLTEVDVAQGAGGALRVGRTTWFVGRTGDEAVFGDHEAETLLYLGPVDHSALDADAMAEKYDVEVVAADAGIGRETVALVVRDRGDDRPRERFYVDTATGVVVRRETFDASGAPVRLVAFTSLDVTPLTPVALPSMRNEADLGMMTMSAPAIELLRETGWQVPEQLPGGFALRSAYALGAPGEAVPLQAVYGDGLYTLSVFQQPGRLHAGGLAPGAVEANVAGGTCYWWPGAQPARVVWSAGATTYTVISDAPPDLLFDAVWSLPHEPGRSLVSRLGRGLRRLGSWAWPFS